MNSFHTTPACLKNRLNRIRLFLCSVAIVLPGLIFAAAPPQNPSTRQSRAITVEGTVRTAAGEPVKDASVSLQEKSQDHPQQTKTDGQGKFVFTAHEQGIYTIAAEKSGFSKCVADPLPLAPGEKKQVDLLLQASPAAMDFDDKPNFTVAGITDWSGAGGHGSDTSLRTSEAFARETLALKSAGPKDASAGNAPERESAAVENKLRATVEQTPGSFAANHQLGEFYFHSGKAGQAIPSLQAAYQINPKDFANSYDLALAYSANGDLVPAHDLATKILPDAEHPADVHRLLGDLDERSGDPLAAVREFEAAANLDPSEPNYFAWGTELLLHRAVSPAMTVFKKGSMAHPSSVRMLVGLSTALYSRGTYDEAARQICHASDLQPDDLTPYLFIGKMQEISPTVLPCSEQKLAGFLKNQPGNALANYYFAMSLLKRDRDAKTVANSQQAEALLKKSLAIDPQLGEAYLQLGILYAAQGPPDRAIAAYRKATEVTPSLSEPHYRLSQLYRRTGETEKAEQEIQLYTQLEKTEADAVERQRREVQQFLIVLKDQPAGSASH
ncbi:MAG: tetratricopeptide repeat protein [Candidatus Acidiferrales bacterium]